MNGIDDKVLNTLRSYKRKIKKPKKFKVYYKILYSNSKNSIFFYTGWGSSPEHFKDIYNPLKHKYNIILFFCPRELLSEDTTKTVNYFEEVKNKTIEAINKLKKKGVKKFNLFGASLGSFLSIYIANRIKIDKMVLFVAGSSLSKTCFTSYADEVKIKLEKKKYNLKKLQKEWKQIEPINNLNNIKKTKIKLYTSLNDQVVLYEFQKKLFEQMKKKKIDVEEILEEKKGHYLTVYKYLKNYEEFDKFFTTKIKDF